jgi:hypothetical protein
MTKEQKAYSKATKASDQYHRFRDLAREVEASEDPKDLEGAIKRVAPVKRPR